MVIGNRDRFVSRAAMLMENERCRDEEEGGEEFDLEVSSMALEVDILKHRAGPDL